MSHSDGKPTSNGPAYQRLHLFRFSHASVLHLRVEHCLVPIAVACATALTRRRLHSTSRKRGTVSIACTNYFGTDQGCSPKRARECRSQQDLIYFHDKSLVMIKRVVISAAPIAAKHKRIRIRLDGRCQGHVSFSTASAHAAAGADWRTTEERVARRVATRRRRSPRHGQRSEGI
jgi:hypothetical protein